jgi:TonB-dependent receptor
MKYQRISLATLCCASAIGIVHGAWAADAASEATATPVGEVVVTAPRQEITARVVQKTAPNLISVRAIETIKKYPDFNAAEALGRMPGIALSSDTGEGRFVQIRGIDANLDGATYGGVPLLNTFAGGTESGGGGRAVEFDTIPTGAVDGIIITYTLLPDHEAEGLGGSIELTPRTAVNITKPFVDVDIGWGDELLRPRTGPFNAEIAFGARFGFGDHGLVIQNGQSYEPRAGFFSNPTPFSFVLSASREDDRRAVDDIEEGYIDDGLAPSNAVTNYDLRRYDSYHRRRFSYGGEFDFQPNDDHRWYARAEVAGYTESVHKNFLLFTGLGDVEDPMTGFIPPDPANPNGFLVTTVPAITETDEEEVHRNSIYSVGGVERWGDVILDYHAAYSRATFHERRNIGAEFDGPTVNFTYDNVSRPNFPIFGLPDGTNLNDPSIYTLNTGSVSNSQEDDIDEEYSYAANLVFPVHLFNDSDRIKIGAQARLRDKTVTVFNESYTAPPLSLATPGLSAPAVNFYNNMYTNGPWINIYAIRNLINSGAFGPTVAVFDPTSYINAKENIYAGYGQFTTMIGKWGFLVGARVEATDANYGGFITTTNPDRSITNTLEYRPVSYTNVFPTVQVRYDFTPRIVLRATYSTGIGRPGFLQNTTAASVDHTTMPLAITRGNPNLQPTTGQNFDLAFEDYLPNGGIISIALFDKEFTNYIVPRIQRNITTDPLSMGALADVTSFLNIGSAYARGVEADYHQKFVFLPKPLDGFGIEANVTVVDSRILEYDAATSGSGANEYGLLPGTSKLTWNLAGFYEAYGLEMRLAAEYVSHSLFGLGGDKTTDTIQDNRLTLDFASSYKINKNFSVYFNAKNLLNTPLRYYEGSPDRPIQREIYDVTLQGGVRASF